MLTKLAIITAGLLSSASPSFARPSPATPDSAEAISPRDDFSRLTKRSYSGMATYYDTETGNQGSCGTWLSNSAYTVAIDSDIMQDSWCGKSIWITYNGNTQYATIEDTCPSCVSSGSIDLSPSLFQAFASEDVGTFSMTWGFSSDTASSSSTPQAWTSTSTTSTYVAPTTSTSQYVAPTTSSTWTPTTTSYTPTSTYTPSTSTTPTSTYVWSSSSSEWSSSSSSSSSSAVSSAVSSSFTSNSTSASVTGSGTAIATLSTSIGDAIISTATTTAAGASSTGTSSDGSTTETSGGNLETLSQLVVNLGRFVVVNAAAA